VVQDLTRAQLALLALADASLVSQSTRKAWLRAEIARADMAEVHSFPRERIQ
jgi:hypothetical protein